MAIDQKSRFCKYCQRKTLHQRELFGFKWGCLLSLLCFPFIAVWLIIGIAQAFKGYRCQVCGN